MRVHGFRACRYVFCRIVADMFPDLYAPRTRADVGSMLARLGAALDVHVGSKDQRCGLAFEFQTSGAMNGTPHDQLVVRSLGGWNSDSNMAQSAYLHQGRFALTCSHMVRSCGSTTWLLCTALC
jgi:hypothetical protein